MAIKFDIPLLGRIPIVQSIRESGDIGEPITLTDESRPDTIAFRKLAKNLLKELE